MNDQPQPAPPGHGPPQQHYGPPVGYAPPPPPKKSNTGKIVAIVLGSIVGFFVLVGGCTAAVLSGADTSTTTGSPPVSAPRDEPKPGAGEAGKPAEGQEAPAESPVKIEATTTEFSPGVLHSGGAFTSVKVTVTNNSDENVDVNPLSFAITDTGGTKHPTDALGEDKNQIDTLTLAPGENVTGTITAEGAFESETVTFTQNMFTGEAIRVDVK